ncbi:MAG: c-type cytochrome biogenesis protein CcmI, partial [Candidatus Saccharibacteria bacterium]|nr:c-type cytochrome biogenesis protein CcmI [Pseudorhodobacter sp.]
MIGFWISAVAMAGMVALVLLQALWRARGQTDGVAPDMAVYRDQLAEVDRDLARGTLTAAEGERLRVEVQRRILEADRVAARLVAPLPSRLLPLVAGLVVLALGAAGWIYQSLGVPGYPDLPLSDRLANADAAYNARPTQAQAEADQPAFVQPEGLDPMIPKLRAALATRPDDLQGHVLLAQNEAALGDFAATRRAQEVVVRLKGADAGPNDLAFLAYAMVRAAGGLVTPEAEKVLVGLLKLDPRNGWGRFYSGLMFAEIGRPDRT